jgi:hypothetical protein
LVNKVFQLTHAVARLREIAGLTDFAANGFTHLVIAQSPAYTPHTADFLLDIIGEYFVSVRGERPQLCGGVGGSSEGDAVFTAVSSGCVFED